MIGLLSPLLSLLPSPLLSGSGLQGALGVRSL
jgi:hypothetical protein